MVNSATKCKRYRCDGIPYFSPGAHDLGGEGLLLATLAEITEPLILWVTVGKKKTRLLLFAFFYNRGYSNFFFRVWTCWRLCATFTYLFLDIFTTSTIRSDFLYLQLISKTEKDNDLIVKAISCRPSSTGFFIPRAIIPNESFYILFHPDICLFCLIFPFPQIFPFSFP